MSVTSARQMAVRGGIAGPRVVSSSPLSFSNSPSSFTIFASSCFRQQTRNASLLRRPLRPYTFTQLVTLSDGSAFVHRSTSPIPVLASLKDSKNVALWNPSNRKLAFMEDDVAGRLRLFRSRFGTSWDATSDDVDKEGTDKGDNITDLTNTFDENTAAAEAAARKRKK